MGADLIDEGRSYGNGFINPAKVALLLVVWIN